jgi:AraC-like DNA-binding protein
MRLSSQDNLIGVFRDSLLEWANQGSLKATLAGPPVDLPAGVRVISASGTPLKTKQGQHARGKLIRWPESKVHGKPNPVLIFVLEGVADLDVGVTEHMAQVDGISEVHGLYLFRVPSRHVLIYPPYFPVSDGSRPHAVYDSQGSSQDSSLLWVDIIPEGAVIHGCRTVAGEHTVGPCVFILDVQLAGLLRSLIEELQQSQSRKIASDIAHLQLRILLLRILRVLVQQQSQAVPDRMLVQLANTIGDPDGHSLQPTVLERACAYIETHLSQELNVEDIARQAFTSPAHLNRAFRRERQQSIMQYVKEQRVEKAKSLLKNTVLPVNTIGNHLGFQSPAYFGRIFRESTGLTPMQFRKNGDGM